MTIKRYQVNRDVPDGHPQNWLGRDVSKGEEFDGYEPHSQGDSILLETSEGYYFQFPLDAVTALDPPVCGGGYFNGVTYPEPYIGPDGVTPR